MPSSSVIGEHYEAFIRSQVAEGRYASASDVVREGLRVLEDRERLRAEVQAGVESGPGIAAEEVFAEARAMIAAARGGV